MRVGEVPALEVGELVVVDLAPDREDGPPLAVEGVAVDVDVGAGVELVEGLELRARLLRRRDVEEAHARDRGRGLGDRVTGDTVARIGSLHHLGLVQAGGPARGLEGRGDVLALHLQARAAQHDGVVHLRADRPEEREDDRRDDPGCGNRPGGGGLGQLRRCGAARAKAEAEDAERDDEERQPPRRGEGGEEQRDRGPGAGAQEQALAAREASEDPLNGGHCRERDPESDEGDQDGGDRPGGDVDTSNSRTRHRPGRRRRRPGSARTATARSVTPSASAGTDRRVQPEGRGAPHDAAAASAAEALPLHKAAARGRPRRPRSSRAQDPTAAIRASDDKRRLGEHEEPDIAAEDRVDDAEVGAVTPGEQLVTRPVRASARWRSVRMTNDGEPREPKRAAHHPTRQDHWRASARLGRDRGTGA